MGVYFVSQNPLDIPDEVLGQLGNRIQHALRAYTSRDQKAVRAAAQTFRTNPTLDTETVITELGVGEALISFLDEKGRPNVVEQALIRPPFSQIGPIEPKDRKRIIQSSLVYGFYEKSVDRESAYEMLKKRAEQSPKTRSSIKKPGRKRQGVVETMAKSAARSIGSQIATQLMRGILGSFLKK